MKNERLENNCSEQRELLNLLLEGETLAPEENVSCKEHLKKCSSCNAWNRQHQKIIERAKEIPQFDVQEQLTQKILSGTSAKGFDFTSSAATLLLFGGALFFLLIYDTVYGIGSWIAGSLFLIMIKPILSGTNKIIVKETS